jgi:SIR2-like domain
LTTTHVLEFLSRILSKFEEGPGRSTTIIPVIMRGVCEHQRLIETAIADAGGVFLDAKLHPEGVVGKIDPRLWSAICPEFTILRSGGKKQMINLVEHQGRVYATIDGNRIGSDGHGLATLCGLATCFCDQRLQEARLAVITYSELDLDADTAGAAWRVFTRQLVNTWVARVQLLVVLVEASEVKYDLHCARGSSLAYRLGWDGLERRKNWDADIAAINRLPPDDDPGLVLFLGAGFSASSGLPLGDVLRDEALRIMFPPRASRPLPDLIDAFHNYVSANDRWTVKSEREKTRDEFTRTLTLERVLREELFMHDASNSPTLRHFRELNARALTRPGRAVRALKYIMTQQRHLIVVTVNFDQLVEQCVPEQAQVFASDQDFRKCGAYINRYLRDGGPVPVLKVHGTIDRLETIVATVDATAEGLSPAKTQALRSLTSRARTCSRRLPWIYIGCSMRDPDLEGLLGQQDFYQRLDEYWVSPFTVATARQFTEKHRVYRDQPDFWHRSITETADVFMEELAQAWGL